MWSLPIFLPITASSLYFMRLFCRPTFERPALRGLVPSGGLVARQPRAAY
jgi:hypothetical protein